MFPVGYTYAVGYPSLWDTHHHFGIPTVYCRVTHSQLTVKTGKLTSLPIHLSSYPPTIQSDLRLLSCSPSIHPPIYPSTHPSVQPPTHLPFPLTYPLICPYRDLLIVFPVQLPTYLPPVQPCTSFSSLLHILKHLFLCLPTY